MSQFGLDTSGVPSSKSLVDTALTDAQGIFSVAPTGKYATGARTIIRINGQLAAFAFSVNWTVSTQQDEIWQIDDYTPYELAPKRITVEGTIGGFHIPGKSPTNLLIAPNLLSFLFHRYITIEIRDRTTDNLLFKTERAVITSRAESISAENMATMTLQWKAIGWADEQPPEYPVGAISSSDTTGGDGLTSGINSVKQTLASGFLAK